MNKALYFGILVVLFSVMMPTPVLAQTPSRGDMSEAISNSIRTGTGKIKELINNGYDVNAKDEDGCTALMEAGEAFFGGSTEIIKMLIEAGADVNAKDEDGRTLLNRAAASGKTEIVKMLIEAGADVDIKDN